MRLRFVCDTCGKPMAAGAIFVRRTELLQAQQRALETVEWDRAHGGVVTFRDLLDRPNEVHAPWRVMHYRCDPTPDDCDYWIGISRIRTVDEFLEWNQQIHSKRWIGHTDWTTGFLVKVLAAIRL